MQNIPVMLLVEDEADDQFFVRHALKNASINLNLQILSRGDEGLAYLKGEGRYADREAFPLPTLIVLDIKLPRISGIEILAWLRKQAQFSSLPAFMMTYSDVPEEIERCRDLGVNGYFVKPYNFDVFSKTLVSAIKPYVSQTA